jgi:hypothetical protein
MVNAQTPNVIPSPWAGGFGDGVRVHGRQYIIYMMPYFTTGAQLATY